MLITLAVFDSFVAAQTVSVPVNIFGKTVGHTYTNAVIGIKLNIPKEMSVDDSQRAALSLPTGHIAGSIFGGKTLTMLPLLSASVPPVSMIITGTKLPLHVNDTTGEAILNDALFRRPADPKAKVEKLGNNLFAYVDGKTRFNQNRSYAIVKRGYYISIVLMFQSQDDLNIMREYLADANFDWNGK